MKHYATSGSITVVHTDKAWCEEVKARLDAAPKDVHRMRWSIAALEECHYFKEAEQKRKRMRTPKR